MRAKLDFEAVQAMLGVFLSCHAESLLAHGAHPDQVTDDDGAGAALALAMRDVLAEQRREGARVLDALDYCLGTLAFLRQVPLTSV